MTDTTKAAVNSAYAKFSGAMSVRQEAEAAKSLLDIALALVAERDAALAHNRQLVALVSALEANQARHDTELQAALAGAVRIKPLTYISALSNEEVPHGWAVCAHGQTWVQHRDGGNIRVMYDVPAALSEWARAAIEPDPERLAIAIQALEDAVELIDVAYGADGDDQSRSAKQRAAIKALKGETA